MNISRKACTSKTDRYFPIEAETIKDALRAIAHEAKTLDTPFLVKLGTDVIGTMYVDGNFHCRLEGPNYNCDCEDKND